MLKKQPWQQVFSFIFTASIQPRRDHFLKHLPVSHYLLFYNIYHLFPEVSDILSSLLILLCCFIFYFTLMSTWCVIKRESLCLGCVQFII